MATLGYAKGNCSHCHEQHASIGGAEPDPSGGGPSKFVIFADNFTNQSEDFCFYCHKGMGSLQLSFDRKNYNYSYWFGGNTVNEITPNNIYDAFNPASYGCCSASRHDLQSILNFVKQAWPETFKDESNPCNACHNPHLSQRGYPVVRPTDRNNIWGDSPGEKMSDYAAAHGGQYMAPFRYNSTSTYEPDGSTITDGSNVPDYVTFCSDCHNNPTNTVATTTPLTPGYDPDNCGLCAPRNLKKIDWANPSRHMNSGGDYHGSITRCADVDGTFVGQWRKCGWLKEKDLQRTHPHPPDYYTDECDTKSGGLYQRDAACAADPTDTAENGGLGDGIPDNIEYGSCNCLSKTTGKGVDAPVWWGAIKTPYEAANYANFILNCTDCHEPHGSWRPYLLRTTVDGKWNNDIPGGPGPKPWWSKLFCNTCHYHMDKTVSTFVPEFGITMSADGAHCGFMGSCFNCHNHGSYDRCYGCTFCSLGIGSVHGHAF